MNIIVWNCRGVSNKGFATMINDLSLRFKSHFICLLETHVGGNIVERIIRKFVFNDWFIMDGVGFSRGIWCIWRKEFWNVEIEVTQGICSYEH